MNYRVFLLIPIIVLIYTFSGCGISQRDIENSIRDEMKSTLSVSITSFDLKKQDDGSYTGTATAENGDIYDVTTVPPKGNKIEWKAIPGQASVEKMVRTGLEQQLKTPVKTLQLTKNGPGNYTGLVELVTGIRMNVTTRMEGMQLLWEANQTNP